MKTLASAVVLAVVVFSSGLQAAADTRDRVTVAWIHHPVSSNPQAQAAFDRGLLDYYAYNPEAAGHEFYTAADLDAHLAMAYWGIALSNAPNLNVDPTDDRSEQAREAIQQAKALENYASPEDRAFIDAASDRFDAKSKASPAALLANYRDALQRIAVAYPTDPDATALFTESTLYVAVGNLNEQTPAQKAARKARITRLLPLFQAALTTFPQHVGLLHFYIHAAQMSGKSSIAVAAATQLAAFTFPPEDSHLAHMPAHTFFDVGMYEAAFNAARRSVAMDYTDFDCCHPGYYSGPRYYHGHNVDFLLYASAQTGRFTEGVAAARRDGDPYFMAISLVADRDWPDVLKVPYEKGSQQDTLPFTRGLAYAKLGDAANARRSLGEIADAPADSPDEAAMVVEAMRLILSGEIAELNHDDAKALTDFTDASKSATKAQELAQAEFPALYYYSPHLALAKLAVRLGKVDVAKAALQAELTASPASPEALRQMGQLASSKGAK